MTTAPSATFRLNKEGRRKLAALKRRRDFLNRRIANYYGSDPARDIGEHAALVWAIEFIEETMPLPETPVRAQVEGSEDLRAATP